MRGRCIFTSLVLGWALLVLPLTGGCTRTQEKTPTMKDPEQAKDMPPRAVRSGGDSGSGKRNAPQTPP
jgi:hypothetical protein